MPADISNSGQAVQGMAKGASDRDEASNRDAYGPGQREAMRDCLAYQGSDLNRSKRLLSHTQQLAPSSVKARQVVEYLQRPQKQANQPTRLSSPLGNPYLTRMLPSVLSATESSTPSSSPAKLERGNPADSENPFSFGTPKQQSIADGTTSGLRGSLASQKSEKNNSIAKYKEASNV